MSKSTASESAGRSASPISRSTRRGSLASIGGRKELKSPRQMREAILSGVGRWCFDHARGRDRHSGVKLDSWPGRFQGPDSLLRDLVTWRVPTFLDDLAIEIDRTLGLPQPLKVA